MAQVKYARPATAQDALWALQREWAKPIRFHDKQCRNTESHRLRESAIRRVMARAEK